MAGETARHVCEHVGHHSKRGYVLAEFLRVDLVERVSFGVVPVEVVRASGGFAQPGYAGLHQGRDVGAAATGLYRSCADGCEQRGDLL